MPLALEGQAADSLLGAVSGTPLALWWTRKEEAKCEYLLKKNVPEASVEENEKEGHTLL